MTTHHRWKKWQSSLIAQQYLSEDAASQGYTLLRLAPDQREVFLDLVSLLRAQAQCAAQDLDVPEVWQDWRRWTRQLTAYLRRLAQGQTGHLPPSPASFALMEDGFDESPPVGVAPVDPTAHSLSGTVGAGERREQPASA